MNKRIRANGTKTRDENAMGAESMAQTGKIRNEWATVSSSQCTLMRTIGSFGKWKLCRAYASTQTRTRRPSHMVETCAVYSAETKRTPRMEQCEWEKKRKIILWNSFCGTRPRWLREIFTQKTAAKQLENGASRLGVRATERKSERERVCAGERNHNIIQYTLQGS